MTDPVALYARLLAGCSTENQRNRLHMALENRLTPEESARLRRRYLAPRPVRAAREAWRRRITAPARDRLGRPLPAATSRGPGPHARAWLTDLEALDNLAGKSRPEPFRRFPRTHGLTVFSAGGPRAAKTLLLCFTGGFQRVMMPMSAFLQHLDAAEVDVAWLRYSRQDNYRSGIRGVGSDLLSSVDALPGLLGAGEYARVAAIGTSGGALPGLLGALRLGLDAVLAVGPASPADPRWATAFDGVGAGTQLGRLADACERLPTISILHSAEQRRDAEAAAHIAGCLPPNGVRVLTWPGSDHNTLIHVARAHRLTALLHETVLPARDTAVVAG